MNEIRTLADAYAAGMCDGEVRLQRGYVTRKPRDPEEIEVQEARGYRGGELYYLAPNFSSTRYCYRIYLTR